MKDQIIDELGRLRDRAQYHDGFPKTQREFLEIVDALKEFVNDAQDPEPLNKLSSIRDSVEVARDTAEEIMRTLNESLEELHEVIEYV